jgi:cbb3-type cytochrome oxidase maturation protein
MEILFLLVPLSTLLVLAILGAFAMALNGGQFDNVEQEGQRILEPDSLDAHQAARVSADRESAP